MNNFTKPMKGCEVNHKEIIFDKLPLIDPFTGLLQRHRGIKYFINDGISSFIDIDLGTEKSHTPQVKQNLTNK